MNEKAGTLPTRRRVLFCLLAAPLFAACASEFDGPATRRRGQGDDDDDPEYDVPDVNLDGGGM